jgi:hypothetical protein
VNEHQELALVDDAFAVQAQFRDGGPTNRGHADHQRVIIAPDKMLVPSVLARVKERNSGAGEWVKRGGFVVLEVVATLASSREVVGAAFAARRQRDDVFIGKTVWAIIFLAKAVFAAALRPLFDQPPQLVGKRRLVMGHRFDAELLHQLIERDISQRG